MTILLLREEAIADVVFMPDGISLCLTLGLLQTSKAVHDDVMAMILSQNTLVVHPEDLDYGLRFLRRLPPRHCYHITDLHVHLYQEWGGESPVGEHKASLHVAAWQKAALHVLKNAKPKTLDLHLICDAVSTTVDASAILQPLLAFPGKLADCEIRLGVERQCRLSTLAMETACHATGNYMNPALRKKPFRFLDLPHELRTSILGYTDLVTPYFQVQWSPRAGFYCIFVVKRCPVDHDNEARHYGCQFRFCGRSSGDCVCASRSYCRAKSSSYSSSCRCWIPPGYLMLVSRTMYREAKAIFYSQNRIIVSPSRDYGLPRPPVTRLSASRFITRHMWPDVLRNLRTLELVFPSFETLYSYSPDDPTFLDWLFAINHLVAHANLDNLTLIVHMTSTSPEVHSDQFKLLQHKIAIADANDNGTSPPRPYARLITPLMALRRVERFFVHLEAPWHYSPRGWDYTGSLLYRDIDRLARRRVHTLEVRLEKFAMGDGYDSYALGKGDEDEDRWSLWARRSPVL